MNLPSGCTTNEIFIALHSKKQSKGVELRRILKNGKFGASSFYEFYGDEKTEQDVIDRMERNNPGRHWVKA